MNEYHNESDAPWFDRLSGDGKSQYLDQYAELLDDLRTALGALGDVANMRLFPVRTFKPEIDIQYFVNDADPDPAGDFERIAANIVAAGGVQYTRNDVEQNSIQRIAELRFGHGHVVYRVVWIDRSGVQR